MHIFLYEWVTGGGLVEEPGPLPESMLIEGRAMVAALAADFCSLPDTRVSVLWDARLADPDAQPNPAGSFFASSRYDTGRVAPPARAQNVEVHSREHHLEEFARLAAEADHTVVIAPEFDSILQQTAARAQRASARLLGASRDFIRIASSKSLTAESLASVGVPVPAGMVVEADEDRLPRDFTYPAVIKPVEGAGSQHTFLVTSHYDEPPPHPWARRLERFIPGIPASVAFLCGPEHRVPLAACRQHLTDDGRLRYLGGSLLWETDLAERATRLADRALAAMPAALGYVGVDLVLGEPADGSEDVVIEINPRLTTSYVGLRAMTHDNLAHAMLEIAAGREFVPQFRLDPLEFSANGAVRRPLG